MVYLNRKSLIKWVICLWLVLLTKKTMILTNLKLLIYLLLVFLVLFVNGGIHVNPTEESKDYIKHAIKKNDEGLLIFYERIGRGIPNGVNTLIYTILKHFVGTPTNVSSQISDY